MEKRGKNHRTVELKAPYRAEDLGPRSRRNTLEDYPDAPVCSLQRLAQSRDTLAVARIQFLELLQSQPGDGPSPVCGPIDELVVHADQFAVVSALDIEFDEIRSQGDAFFNRGQRILGCMAARAPMTDLHNRIWSHPRVEPHLKV